jgi:hypothetical protein
VTNASSDPGDLVLWQGWEPRRAVDLEQAIALLTAPGHRGELYVLDGVAARGFRPPRLLTITPVVNVAEPEHEAPAELRQVWAVTYRQIAETTARQSAPYAIYLLGVNPPDGLSSHELAEFDAFYTDVHLREVAERRHALRAVRYERVDEIKPPYPSAPSYLAAYELDEASAAVRKHTGPAYSPGPAVWQRHTTPWRLWYLLRSSAV